MIAVGRLRLRVGSAGLAPGAPGDRVNPAARDRADDPVEHPGPGVNVLRGTVKRASFLGDSVDYEIAVADSDVVLRVVTPVGVRRRVGDAVGLAIDPAACITLADSGG